MPKRILVAALFAVVCGAFVPPEAFAVNNQAYKYLFTTVDQGWKGSRVTVDNPSGSQMSIQQPIDFDLTSAYAGDNGHGNLIQIGVQYEWQSPEGPSCNLGSSSATLYYFVETLVNTVGNCYNLGTASGGAQNKMSVQRGSDNLWHAYQNGVGSGVSTTWTDCGGNGFAGIAEAHGTLVTPEGQQQPIGGGFGHVAPNQVFNDVPGSIGTTIANAARRFGLRSTRVSTVTALQPAVVIHTTTDTPTASVNALIHSGGLSSILGGSPTRFEGVYLEIRDTSGAPIYISATAARAGAATFWADPSLGLQMRGQSQLHGAR